jgi:hypothetical protein
VAGDLKVGAKAAICIKREGCVLIVDLRRRQIQARAMAWDSLSLYGVAEMKSKVPTNVSSETLASLETDDYEFEVFTQNIRRSSRGVAESLWLPL